MIDVSIISLTAFGISCFALGVAIGMLLIIWPARPR